MNYAIQWQPDALNELAAVWLSANSEERAAITSASRQIERVLQFDAHTQGESRSEEWRIVFAPPLAVTFEADSEKRVVRVLHARRYSTRRR